MQTVNIHEAKTRLSQLLEQVAKGEPFVIAKSGKPIAKVVPYSSEPRAIRKIGFMAGQISVPDDFDTMFAGEIVDMFESGS